MTDDDFNEAYDMVPIEPGPHDPPRLPVNKITWPQVGRVTGPGRYMFTFGWLTVTAEDLAVWEQFPNAAFTLFRTRLDTIRRAVSSAATRWRRYRSVCLSWQP